MLAASSLGLVATAAAADTPEGSLAARGADPVAAPLSTLEGDGESDGVGVDESDAETSDGEDDSLTLVLVAVAVGAAVVLLFGTAWARRRRDPR